MSFGGHVAAMIASIKNNARAKRKNYFERKDVPTSRGRGIELRKATPQELAHIKSNMILQNKKRKQNNLIALSVTVFLILVSVLLFNYYFSILYKLIS
ncbi:MAG: hypothetical protein CVT95_04290 [Bacteroidetes bacterium HGW-Bacteroidetes-12]|nr:MAG: hypothetical protein CVT95_04290 [Bacteroidetes bacterium HGW-Bacteroidetes-12]